VSLAASPIEVAAGLVFRDRKLLITQRRPDAYLGRFWEFPGGKREPCESFEDCLRRELREELGIEIEILRLFDAITHAYTEKTVLLKFYLCRWTRNEPQALGCEALAWVSQGQLLNFSFPAADAQLIKKLQNDSELWNP
jgi:mutator protein MutT